MDFKNRKGYMLVELVLATLIAAIIAAYMFSLTVKQKNNNDDLLVETTVTTNTALATNKLLQIISDEKNKFDCGKIVVEEDLKTIKYVKDENKEIIVAVYDKYATLNRQAPYCTSDKDDDESSQIHIGVNVPQLPDKNFDIVIDYIKRRDPSPNVLFEGVGHYGYATAGNNNATNGTELVKYDHDWVCAPPGTDTKNEPANARGRFLNILGDIKEELSHKGYDIGDIEKIANGECTDVFNNISGSKLEINPGDTVKQAVLSYYAYGQVPTGSDYMVQYSTGFEGEILLIKIPDDVEEEAKWDLIQYTKKNEGGWVGYPDITRYIKLDDAQGWYYVAFIGAGKASQTAWSITAMYESQSSPYSYGALLINDVALSGAPNSERNTFEIMFDFPSSATYQQYRIMGTFMAGGLSGWSCPHVEWDHQCVELVGDKVEAILSDGTTQELWEENYNGKTIFENRKAGDFVSDTYNTIRNHNIPGGEVDIFNEVLDNDYFNRDGNSGRTLKGLRITKTGTDTIYPGLIGISVTVAEK